MFLLGRGFTASRAGLHGSHSQAPSTLSFSSLVTPWESEKLWVPYLAVTDLMIIKITDPSEA